MTVEDAATQYIRGFYLRPDLVDRDWSRYQEEAIEGSISVFNKLYKHGGEVLSIGHLYTTGQELTVQVELRLPNEGALDLIESFGDDCFKLSHKPHPVYQWAHDFICELISDSGNEVYCFSIVGGALWDCKLLISEQF